MTVKAAFVIYDVGEENSGQVRAACRGKIFDGAGTGASFNQDFNFDPEAPNVNSQIHASVKQYLQSTHSVSFGPSDVLMLLPSIL